jgi:hypothetical protein
VRFFALIVLILWAFGFGAWAQALAELDVPMNLPGTPGANLTEEQKDQYRAMEKEYERKLKAIPEKKITTDPWGNMRGTQPRAPQDRQ